MTRSPQFSAIIPVFNAGGYLRPAVESVLSQTCTDFELLLIDDGSTDGSVDQVRQLGDRRIQFFWQPNQGPASACNLAIAKAAGVYVAFLDQDDLWAPPKLARHAGRVAIADP